MKKKEKIKFIEKIINSCIIEDQLHNTMKWGMKIHPINDILKIAEK